MVLISALHPAKQPIGIGWTIPAKYEGVLKTLTWEDGIFSNENLRQVKILEMTEIIDVEMTIIGEIKVNAIRMSASVVRNVRLQAIRRQN